MNWEAIGAVGEIVGAVGVLASLIYLATQIRTNSKFLWSQNVHAQTEQMQRIYDLQTNTDLRDAIKRSFVKGSETNVDDFVLLESYLASALAAFRDVVLHYDAGIYDEENWQAQRRTIGKWFSIPWCRAYWIAYGRDNYEQKVVKEVDALIAETPVQQDIVLRVRAVEEQIQARDRSH